MILRWLNLALEDHEHAVRYLCKDTNLTCEHVAEKVLAAAESIAEDPDKGTPGRVADTQECVVDGTPFLMVYRVRDNTVEILRVLHPEMRWSGGTHDL